MYNTLEQVFGYPQFRAGQEAAISAVLAGRSAAAIFPTGSGKSLCYQLPAVLLPHLTLVVSPLLALMQDQLAFLQRHGIAAASIDSVQSRDEASAVMARAKAGELKILMVSVERLKNERFRHFLQQVPISLLVVDEAHCISEWGHNFRPDYLKLPDYQHQFNIPQALLLTATATPAVIADMQRKFAIAESDVVTTGFYRANLDLWVEPVTGTAKRQRLVQWMGERPGQPSIVYVTLQKTAEQIAQHLSQHGISANAYHAGLPHEQRESIQRQFMAGQLNCIVATIAFGMGIDKSDIRNVVHFDLPKSIENYSQEIGRAGRDGATSECLVLANRDSLNVLENFVYGDTPELQGIRCVLEELSAAIAEGQWEFMLTPLSDQSNIRQLPLKTLLVQLELRGLIAPRYAYFAEYRFKFLIEPDALLAKFEGERQQFVAAIIQTSSRARTWATVNFDTLYEQHQADRNRVVKALDYFQEKGWIELESKQMTEVYNVLVTEVDAQALSLELHQYFTAHERSEIARIHAMLALFSSDTCLSHRLAQYFGDEQAPQQCGHCSVCAGQIARLPDPPALAPLVDKNFEALCGAFIHKHQEYAGSYPPAERVTRFLCGISVPLFTKIKARSIAGFAALENYPYADVRHWAEHHLADEWI
ncbi:MULTISPECIES: ATP-dependent DNA helicase RecQ [unclassified Pseudomonas]|uniref:RecQ family ATP-dependent DNA helicase n=1 Tax=unclassified Pseudomonas TaxID=196821 RepID=UPI001296548B|nr:MULTISPECIES: ATP-dependent DNA helicase RecQ [unclassified Pseudomonas]MDU7556486.1 ATP-dependent DNA helicase RecQ [Pseudomonas sp.]MQT42369.1 RecQ family ATP-dependent DNA helicase [Pseudomonas sp. FSL R10-0765]MQT51774.1 RecQ family ATP-dependent DNA helicase [Pseudomonas sp. FSL R10-2398]MQU01839.1 RecQ family ATP-dependent DNA helicase [Pseudomonas sp. FSL R10-2245]MQU10257.1 RecQ family ATP-dependent DNA helicase [Pseudomonas sp. FSL R10-2189]